MESEGGSAAVVVPHDIVREHATCTQAPQRFTHTATVTFSEPGMATVIGRGRASRDADVVVREFKVQVDQ